ncbi:MAG: YdeI/OmpD-associated family protein [Thermoplasmata archaeon]|nr:YdeI/OmpD-associated family protein [Thermoplasmata archaeon]
MEITETLYVKTRKEFRTWLETNHSSKKEIWLIYYKKHTGKPRIPYDDAVEEAICFGWIDSTVKRIDDEKYCQRYTPRNYKSIWSDLNVMRVKKMLDAGQLTDAGLEKIPPGVMKAAKSGNIQTFTREGHIIPKVLEPPEELLEALAANETAQKNWDSFPHSRKRQIIWWIGDAKRAETRERRIAKAVTLAEDNVRIAM